MKKKIISMVTLAAMCAILVAGCAEGHHLAPPPPPPGAPAPPSK